MLLVSEGPPAACVRSLITFVSLGGGRSPNQVFSCHVVIVLRTNLTNLKVLGRWTGTWTGKQRGRSSIHTRDDKTTKDNDQRTTNPKTTNLVARAVAAGGVAHFITTNSYSVSLSLVHRPTDPPQPRIAQSSTEHNTTTRVCGLGVD